MPRNFQGGYGSGGAQSIATPLGALGFSGAMSIFAAVRIQPRPSDGLAESGIIKLGGFSGSNFVDFYISGGGPNMFGAGSNKVALDGNANVNPNEWCLTGFTKGGAGSTPTFYYMPLVNGTLKSSAGSGSVTLNNTTNTVLIGYCQNTIFSGGMMGDIAMIGVWNATLSTSDISSLAATLTVANWLATSTAAPKALWFLDDRPSTVITDQTGNGADQTNAPVGQAALAIPVSIVRSPIYLPFPPRY